MASQWIRWNPATHIDELSTDNGTTWIPLPKNASILNEGTVNTARLGSGVADATTFLRGDSSWQALSIPDAFPTGGIISWPTAVAPAGYQLCDGSSLLRATFAALFAVIGTTFGAVDGTHFNVPDCRQRFIIGLAAAGTGSVLGGTGGLIDHLHTGPSHTHTYTDIVNHTHTITITDPGHKHNGHSFTSPVAGHSAPSGGYQGANNDNTSGGDDFTTSSTTGITAASSNPAGGLATGTTAASGTGNTGTANPPFIALNYIIKT